jgi:hypothetical protein
MENEIPPLDEYLEDWSLVKKRWEAFWEHGLYDRPILQVKAPRQGVFPQTETVDAETQWTDISFMIDRTLRDMRSTYYGGEAIPWCWNPISAGYAVLFGCKPHFTDATVFVDPAAAEEDGYPALDGWRESSWWPWIREGMRAFAQASRRRFFVPVFWGNSAMDILGVVRGVEDFMMDIACNPAWVKQAVRRMNEIQHEIFEEIWEFVQPEATGMDGNVDSSGFWSPGKARTFDADLAYNISNRAFKELILPPMAEWMQEIDNSSWHLDGKGNLTHLETLLDLPQLKAIQWVQGDGPHKPILPWVPLIRKIQERGKSIQVLCEPEEVESLLAEISPEGLAISTYCKTEGEARRLLERLKTY